MYIPKKKRIGQFINELELAQEQGYVSSLCTMLEKNSFDRIVSIGVEILFSDFVQEKQIDSIKTYVESRYGFFVDATSLYHPLTQIIIVKYE